VPRAFTTWSSSWTPRLSKLCSRARNPTLLQVAKLAAPTQSRLEKMPRDTMRAMVRWRNDISRQESPVSCRVPKSPRCDTCLWGQAASLPPVTALNSLNAGSTNRNRPPLYNTDCRCSTYSPQPHSNKPFQRDNARTVARRFRREWRELLAKTQPHGQREVPEREASWVDSFSVERVRACPTSLYLDARAFRLTTTFIIRAAICSHVRGIACYLGGTTAH
jgi:hypothetical protein